VRRMLGYSSIGQIGLLTTVAALAPILTPAFSRAEGSGLLSGLLNGSLGGSLLTQGSGCCRSSGPADCSLGGIPPLSGILGKTAFDHDACFNR